MNQNRVRDSSHSEERNSPSGVFTMSSDWCNAVHVTMTKIHCSPPPREGQNIEYTNRYRVFVTHNIFILFPLYLPPLTTLHCTSAPHTCTAGPPSSPSHHLDTQHTTYDHVHPSWAIREPGLCRCLQNLRRRSQCFLRGHHLHPWQWYSVAPPV